MDLPGITVTDVDFQSSKVVVTVKLRNKKFRCPQCEFAITARYDTRPVASSWRHLDLGRRRLEVRADLSRPAPDRVPHSRSPHRGRPLRPGQLSLHPRLRGPGGLARDHHGQDRLTSPGAH
jgi:hypothetical protein